ncbi:GNAT family N-acetyltransferase [Actinokineospora bangkokensis]|uniref:GNAT family N-acetyltransferase n=1 Tax=Actinokineospora bangkokensis TaxID=1193682 RepID=A0A1Q9LM54_9PSEU|nr:GNAT family N-acetyltransferase [Actinokineospora bangkokensis]OLR93095.1 GNAT family N-acetyltransferase [Actinokineospora bangkokensis]
MTTDTARPVVPPVKAGEAVLDNAIWASLTGAHARFAEGTARALRYRADVAGFVGIPDEPDERVWPELAALVGPGNDVVLTDPPTPPPADWPVLATLGGVQLEGAGLAGERCPEAVVLTRADVPEVLDLVARTKPGPFLPGTIEMGTYLGIRRGGWLVAMAGERLHPPGWTEVSAVCTDQEHRGRGLAGALVLAVVHGIRARGEQPVIHAVEENAPAIRLYQQLGFRLRRRRRFLRVAIPTTPGIATPRV